MKMFKKLMAVALVGVMALSMLTGCAVTNAIAEDKAEKALENACKTVTGETVNFKSLSVGSNVTNPVKADIKNGTILLKDGETYAKTVKSGDKVYTVVVVTEPKSATKIENWKHTALNVMMAAIEQGKIDRLRVSTLRVPTIRPLRSMSLLASMARIKPITARRTPTLCSSSLQTTRLTTTSNLSV